MTDSFDDFDDTENEKKGSDEFAKMLEASFSKKEKKLSVGDKIKGEILVLGKEDVFVSTGTMNDGIVPRRDLLDAEGDRGELLWVDRGLPAPLVAEDAAVGPDGDHVRSAEVGIEVAEALRDPGRPARR